MKIGIVSTPVFRCVGPQGTVGYAGLESLAWHKAKGLAAKGHDVTLFAPDGSECPGAIVFPIGPERGVDERQAFSKSWPELLKQDVIIEESWSKWSYSLKAEGRLPRTPILAVMHAPVATMYQTWPPAFSGKDPIEKACPVCISEDQGRHFEALFGRPCRVAYNGVDTDYYKATGVPRNGRFLFLARFSTVKSPDLAIQACKDVGVGLDLVGDLSITNEPDYLAKCQAMCDGTKIRFVGGATRGECVNWFSQSHAMIHPTKLFREPFGLAPVESMACGTPVIAWNWGACKETIVDGKTGSLVGSYDELVLAVRIAAEHGYTKEFREACVAQARKFSVQRMIDRYDELIHEAVDSGGW